MRGRTPVCAGDGQEAGYGGDAALGGGERAGDGADAECFQETASRWSHFLSLS